MREYQHKHMIRTLLYSRVTIVILFIMVILIVRSIVELNNKRIEVNKLRDQTHQERALLETKAEVAKKQSESIVTERGYEGYVRTTYPVVKEGEGVIIIYEGKEGSVTEVREDMNVWEKLLVTWRKLTHRQ